MIRCETCIYHEPKGEGRGPDNQPTPIGVCFRFPPQVNVQGGSSSPIVGSTNGWCGEHRAKPKPAAKPKKGTAK